MISSSHSDTYTENRHALRIVVLLSILIFTQNITFAVKPLSTKDRERFSAIAAEQYNNLQIEGASIQKYKGRKILLTIVEVKTGPNMQRVAQVKATRLAGEFLESARNRSVTVYETVDSESYKLNDSGLSIGDTRNNHSDSHINQHTEDVTKKMTEDKFSDKIIQESLSRVGHMECLSKIGTFGNISVFAYFMML